MKSTHKILVPNMLPWHFGIIEEVLKLEGYDVEILQNDGRAVIDEGLKHVHNDTCYPCLCVVGQYINALKSGNYDLKHTAVLITQTGGGCRASNYMPLIRKALKAEFPEVPVVSVNFSGLERDSSFNISAKLFLIISCGLFLKSSKSTPAGLSEITIAPRFPLCVIEKKRGLPSMKGFPAAVRFISGLYPSTLRRISSSLSYIPSAGVI